MNNIFKVKENKRLLREQYKLNLDTPEWNQVTFLVKRLKVYIHQSSEYSSFSYQSISKSNSI